MSKIYTVLVVLLALPVTACDPADLVEAVTRDAVTGSGNIIRESRDLPEFDSVNLEGSIHAEIMRGENFLCKIDTDDNIMPLVVTEVRNRTLTIRMKPGITLFNEVNVYLEAPAVREASVSGSGDIILSDLIGEKAELYISGSGDLTAFGEVERLVAGVNGSGDMHLAELHAREAVVEINGSGDIEVNASGYLECEINGSGAVKYKGNPQEIRREINGSGDIRQTE